MNTYNFDNLPTVNPQAAAEYVASQNAGILGPDGWAGWPFGVAIIVFWLAVGYFTIRLGLPLIAYYLGKLVNTFKNGMDGK